MISFHILSLVASILLCIEAGITFLALKYADDMLMQIVRYTETN
jgi:hypothetical protein